MRPRRAAWREDRDRRPVVVDQNAPPAPIWSRQAAHPGSVGRGHWRAPPWCFRTDGPRYGEFSMIRDMLFDNVSWRRRGEQSLA